MTAIDILSIDHGMAWRPWAVFYFFLIGASVGAALLAVAARAAGRDGRSALMAAAALAVAAPLPLLADLHQPGRFLHFYLGTAPQSVMWWGSWLMPLYVACVAGLAGVVSLGLAAARPSLERALLGAVALTGLGVLSYTAGEMTVVAARPLWHSVPFPVVLTLTALTGGAGMSTLFAALRGEESGAARWVIVIGSAFALVILGLWMLLDPEMSALALEQDPAMFLGGLLGLGLVVPGILGLIAGAPAPLRALTGLAAMFGTLAYRWEMFTGAQLMSKTEGAFFGHASLTAPATLHAAVGSAGVLALAVIAVVVLFSALAPRGGRRTHA